ncbi:MAG: LolA family protein [Hyphomicrobiaceae bacterium]
MTSQTVEIFRFGWMRASHVIGAVLLIFGMSATANGAKEARPSSPVGSGWDSKVRSSHATAGHTFSASQSDAIAKVNDYFNNLVHLQGRFIQTDPDRARTKGRFYVKKPGRFRFVYSRPSRKIVVSDGHFLAIQDLDLRSEDVYALDNTPFRMLLRKDVNLLRDARILAVKQTSDRVALTLADKDPDAVGQITVFMSLRPRYGLAGWVTYDAQGLETRVDVGNLSRPRRLDAKLFKREELFKDAFNSD